MMARASTKPLDPVATPMLVPQGQHAGKQSMPISRPLTVIGSRHRAHLHLLSRSVSKSHAVIGMEEGGVYIRDLASRTHVYVNGKMVREADLHDGDLVKIGAFTFKYTDKRKRPLLDKPKRISPAAIEVEGSALPIEFHGRVLLIGRRPTCDISLMEMSVSTCHAVIFEQNGQRFLRDLGSRTGTFINGQLVHQAPIQIGDAIRVGETDMKLVAHGTSAIADDLEDLVGTAPLGDEMLALADEDLAPPPPVAKKPAPTKRKAPPAPPAPIAAPPAAKPQLKPVFEPEPEVAPAPPPVEVEPVAEIPLATTAAKKLPAAEELDLAPLEPIAPAIEDRGPASTLQVVPPAPEAKAPQADSPSRPEGDHIQIEPDEPPHLLVDANLYTDAMSGSGTFAGIPGEVEQADSEAVLDAASTEPVDLGLDFWHDEPPAPAVAAAPPASEADKAPAEDAPLPLLGVEEPDDLLSDGAPTAAAQPPIAAAKPPEDAASAAASVPDDGIEAKVGASMAPVELGPELTAPAAPEHVAGPLVESGESILPGLVLPAGAVERPADSAPLIPPAAASPAIEADAASPDAIDLSHVQFRPEASEPAGDWPIDESESAEPTSLLGLDVSTRAQEPGAASSGALEISLPPTLQEPADEAAGSAEGEDDTAESAETEPQAPAKPKRKRRRRKAKSAEQSETTTNVPEAEVPAAASEPAHAVEPIAEMEPLAESAREPVESYSAPPGLVEPITEAQVAEYAADAIAMPMVEPSADLAPTLEAMEESLEPAFELPAQSPEIELPIENDGEAVATDDALEFNFEESAEGTATAQEAGPAWIADAQTTLPEFEEGTSSLGQLMRSDEESLAPVDEESALPLPDSAPPAEAGAPEPKTDDQAPAPLSPMAKLDPFRGMANDLGSFIGGMPLPLPPTPKIPMDDGSSLTFAKPPKVPIAPLDVSEPPPELFDAEPEALDAFPEALEKIEDVEQAIGKEQPAPGKPPMIVPPRPRKDAGSAPFGSTPLSPGLDDASSLIAARKAKSPVSARRGQVTTAFDGLALQPVRQADVFSQMNPPDVDSAFSLGDAGGPGAPTEGGIGAGAPVATPTSLTGDLPEVYAEPGRRNSRAYLDRRGMRPVRGGRASDGVEPDLLEADPSAADFAGPGVEQHGETAVARRAMPVLPGAPTPQFHPMPATPMPSRFRQRRWPRVELLLMLMVLIAGAATAAIWYLVPVKYLHRASLTYNNLDKVDDEHFKQFLKDQKARAASTDVLKLAESLYSGKGGPGFLDPQGTPENRQRLALLLDKDLVVPPGSSMLEFSLVSNDRDDDGARLGALVNALATKDRARKDEAARVIQDRDTAVDSYQKIRNEITALQAKRQSEEEARDQLASLAARRDAQKTSSTQLYNAWQHARQTRMDLEQAIRSLEATAAGAAASQPAQAAPAADDAQSKQLAEQIDQVQTQLATIRTRNNSNADQANAALDTALKEFGEKVSDAQTKLKDSSALREYLNNAQAAQQVIADVRAEVTEEEKSYQEHLTEMKDQLATMEKRHNEAIWASDPQLKQWQQDLDVDQHHLGGAQDPADPRPDDAARIQSDMDKLTAQIATRRDQLIAENPQTAEINDIRKLIDDWLDARTKEQARDDQRMAEEIQKLSKYAPKLSGLPDDQKALAENLEKQQAQLEKARQQYALALQNGPQLDNTSKQLETQLADLNAKLSAHRREVLDANHKTASNAEAMAVEQEIKEKEGQLGLAKQREDAASVEYDKSSPKLRSAEDVLQQAQALVNNLDPDTATLADLNQQFNDQEDVVNEAKSKVGQLIIPADNPVRVDTTPLADNRFQYMLVAVIAAVLVFSPMIYLSSTSHAPGGHFARPAGLARPQGALPPRPVFASSAAPASGPQSEAPVTLTSLTASGDPADSDPESSKATGELSSSDAMPAAGF